MSNGKITRQELSSDINGELDKIGNLSQLQTTDKSSLVNANNEINNNLAAHLNDYTQFKEELTQPDTLTTPKQISPIIDLPNAINGQASVGVSGRTYNNIVKNGNFANGLNEWSYPSGTTVNDGICTFTVNYQNGGIVNQITSHETYKGHKLYFSASAKTEAYNIYLLLNDGTGQTIASIPPTGRFEHKSNIRTIASDTTMLFIKIQDQNDSNWQEIQAANFIAVDLTATFGAGNEPTLEECDKIFSYISGTKSTTNTRIKSVGKNLFDNNSAKLGVHLSHLDGNLIQNPERFASDFIKISNQQYIKTGDPDITPIAYYDINKNFISGDLGMTINPPTNSFFVRIGGRLTYLDDTQLEEGPTATTYEPYKESISYITLPEGVDGLHSLPNGVKDEVTTDGKLIKRASKRYISKDEILDATVFATRDYGHSCLIALNNPITNKAEGYGDNYVGILNGNIILKSLNSDRLPDALIVYNMQESNVGKFVIGIPSSRSGWSSNPTEQQIKDYFANYPLTLIYQLAEPQIYDLAVTPVTCFKDGTIYIESADDSEEYVVPETQFTYPVNTAAVIQGNVEGINELGNLVSTRIIEESGSNANGEYIRFADGTLVCYNIANSPIGNVPNGTLWVSNPGMAWTFPYKFISKPNIFFNAQKMLTSGANPISISRITTVDHSSSLADSIYVVYQSASDTVSTQVGLLAIGRWK